MKYTSLLLSLMLCQVLVLSGQEVNALEQNSLQLTALSDPAFKNLVAERIAESQFIMLGEQHGIKEVGTATQVLYDLGQSHGFNRLCVETDDLAAQELFKMAQEDDPIKLAKAFQSEYPFAIPFYNNSHDYQLLSDVVQKGGHIWGIDQTFMVQYRFNFAYLAEHTKNKAFANRLLELKAKADETLAQAIKAKNYQTFIFQYDEALHQELLSMAQTPAEKEILDQLWKTKIIYGHNFEGRYYLNNEVRGQLMKQNFMRYYRQSVADGVEPKVVFKLGANHAARGLTRTNIYDISNLVSELAIMNGNRSFHLMVLGLDGEQYLGNPFAPSPIMPFDNREQLPKEVVELSSDLNKKYLVLDLEPLRPQARKYSEKLQSLIFKYDLLILVKGAEALDGF